MVKNSVCTLMRSLFETLDPFQIHLEGRSGNVMLSLKNHTFGPRTKYNFKY